MKSSSRRPRIHVAKCPGKPRQFARNELRRRPLTQVERHSIFVLGAARNFFFAAHNARRDTCSPPGRTQNRAGPVETVTGLPLRKPRGNPRGDPRKMSYIDLDCWIYNRHFEEWRRVFNIKTRDLGRVELLVDNQKGI